MSASDDSQAAPEFSRPFKVADLGTDGTAELTAEATEAERAALAERFELRAIDALSYTAKLTRWRGGVRVTGRVKAEAAQTCGVTLGPVSETIDDTFDRGFLPSDVVAFPDDRGGLEFEMRLDREIDDATDLLTPFLDVAELAAEAFGLALDPYPRADDAALERFMATPPGAEPLTDDDMKPFAGLAKLKALKDSTDGEGSGE